MDKFINILTDNNIPLEDDDRKNLEDFCKSVCFFYANTQDGVTDEWCITTTKMFQNKLHDKRNTKKEEYDAISDKHMKK